MKLLIVGIDGGTAEIFDAFDMPFWQSLRRQDVTFDVTEDLNQRGWARMLSGRGAHETGGLYMRPHFDAPFEFDFSYNFGMMSETPGFTPIWQFAEESGSRVAMMNVPTTSPAQSVNGFYVAGGGGGIAQGGVPDDAVYPTSIKESLKKHGYIFDTRLGAQRFVSPEQVCDHINKMMVARQRSFTDLSKKLEIDFGFCAFRATTVLQFLAMSEIAHAMRFDKSSDERRSWSPHWLPLIEKHFRMLDDCLARMFDELQPEHHIVASDHSIVPWTHNVDFNGFLAAAGYARFVRSPDRFARNAAKTVVRRPFRKQILNTPLGAVPGAFSTAGARLTRVSRAFSGFYVYGIYINDRDRFGGPVPDGELSGATEGIVDEFNWAARQFELPLRAAPYRERFAGGPSADILPDVTILQSGYAFPSNNGMHWYARNPNFGPVTSVRGVGGMHSGQKGVRPILMADTPLARLTEAGDPEDLRLVHELTRKLFSGETSP